MESLINVLRVFNMIRDYVSNCICDPTEKSLVRLSENGVPRRLRESEIGE